MKLLFLLVLFFQTFSIREDCPRFAPTVRSACRRKSPGIPPICTYGKDCCYRQKFVCSKRRRWRKLPTPGCKKKKKCSRHDCECSKFGKKPVCARSNMVTYANVCIAERCAEVWPVIRGRCNKRKRPRGPS